MKKHKKEILIAAGVAAVALTAQPYIIPAIMHANSVLWTSAPALRGFLHGCNLVLGKTIGASYVGSSGLWTAASGALINASAAEASLLGALAIQATTIGVIGTSAKKLVSKIQEKIKKKNENVAPTTENSNSNITNVEDLTDVEDLTLDPDNIDALKTDEKIETPTNSEKEREELKNKLQELKKSLQNSNLGEYSNNEELLKEEGGKTL